MRTVPSSARSAVTPMLRMSLSMVRTSCNWGTLSRVTGSAVSSAAHNSGRAAFWRGDQHLALQGGRRGSGVCPSQNQNGVKVRSSALESSASSYFKSKAESPAGGPFGGVKVFIDRRMHLVGVHACAQRGVHALVALIRRCPRTRPRRWWRTSGGRRLQGDVVAGQASADDVFELVCSHFSSDFVASAQQVHGQCASRQARPCRRCQADPGRHRFGQRSRSEAVDHVENGLRWLTVCQNGGSDWMDRTRPTGRSWAR